MFRIRRIYDNLLPINKKALSQIAAILKERFSLITDDEIFRLPDHLYNPVKYRFKSILFVAEDMKGTVKGFALLMHYSDLNFCYLDYISTSKSYSGRGIGSALYEKVREETRTLKAIGLFYECLPDDPALCRDPVILNENKRRLKFYEQYGARPIINTKYETPLQPGEDNPPYLVFDGLGTSIRISAPMLKIIIMAILERKYSGQCSSLYVDMVVSSVEEDPVQLRPFRYIKKPEEKALTMSVPDKSLIYLVYNNQHEIHHIKEKGYVESPVRVNSILKHLSRSNLFKQIPAFSFSEKNITAVHDWQLVNFFKSAINVLKEGESIYPYIFPIRNASKLPKDLSYRAGYYCIDTFTPINKNAFLAARNAVNCALTCALKIVEGSQLAYALVRPPGHHAERRVFGGFCYLNSTAIASRYLAQYGKVAILDIDYHHGNGQQEIFYERSDIFTVSIHGHPSFSYPFFSGFRDEEGKGEGKGFNWNLPLPEKIESSLYVQTLEKVLVRIKKFAPRFLVVALGLDTARGDPTGSWALEKEDYFQIGRRIGSLPLPTLVVQEGGYNSRSIGINALHFFNGLYQKKSLNKRKYQENLKKSRILL